MSDPVENAINAEHAHQERAWDAYCIAHDQAMENGRRLQEMLAKCSARFEHIRQRLITGFEGDPLARLGLADYAAQCIAEIAASADTRPQGGDAKQAPFTSGAVPSEAQADAQKDTPHD